MKTPRGLERLFGVPPRDFISARNTLAAELRRAGDADAARVVSRLRRPSAPLWAVNQLARSARPALERFLDAVGRLRRNQLSDPRGSMEAMRKQREHLDALVARATEALRESGARGSAEATRRIATALLGAAADPTHAVELRAGRLLEEPPAPGFEALAGTPRGRHLRVVERGAVAPSADDAARPAPRGARETARAGKGEARECAAQERQRQADERQRAAEERRRQTEEQRREAARQAAELAGLEREAATARERLAEIDRRLSEARRAARASRPRARGGRPPATRT